MHMAHSTGSVAYRQPRYSLTVAKLHQPGLNTLPST